jgi:hypothetical protein
MPRRHLVPTLLLAVALAVTGCGDDDTPAPTQGSAASAASDEQLNLKGSCPATVVVQPDWDPESEYGVYYHLLGPNPEVDTERKRVSAPLVAQGKDTGVRLEVRTGGPSIGFGPVSAQMYKDKSITLGQVSTDEAIRFSAGQPTQAVVAPMEVSPFMIMWDPATYPGSSASPTSARPPPRSSTSRATPTAPPRHTRGLGLSVLSDPGGA